MIRVFNKFEPIPESFIEIDTTSRGPYKDLSPFYLGPYSWYDGEVLFTCNIFENLWQYSKVYYPQHNYTSYYEWRNIGFSKTRAERYPMGKGVKPDHLLWKGVKYSYIDARKAVYIPIYAHLVRQTKSYAMLYRMTLEGKNIALRDFDGYDHVAKGMTLEQVITNEKRSMGHAFIIYGLLTGEFTEDQITP